MKFAVAILIVIAAMAIKDVLGTAMTIYEARGNGHRAGLMDSLGDIANVIYVLINVDTLNKVGVSWEGALMLFAVCATSYNTTRFTVNWLREKA